MPHHSEEHTGARIARVRKRRGLTQQGLAAISAVSYSTITKVEQGNLPASPAVVGALARALSVPVAEMNGQPYLEELRQDKLDELIQPIREALDVYDLGADPEVTPRPAEELAQHAEALCELVRHTDLKRVASELPGLITEVTTAAHQAQNRRLWQVLSSTYRTAYDVTTKLGFIDLCTVALDRMGWAAQKASDPVLAGMRQYMRALVYMRAADYRTGQRLVRDGLLVLEQGESGVARDAARGQLHLGAAVLSARSRDGDTADGHLVEAEQIANRIGSVERVHWLAFGPTNVRVHRVSALAERDLYDDAVREAHGLHIPHSWPRSRVGHHHAEVARAQMLTNRPEDAFRSLTVARRSAPQQTRYHPLVRETYAGLAAARRRQPQSFSGFGAWLGM